MIVYGMTVSYKSEDSGTTVAGEESTDWFETDIEIEAVEFDTLGDDK